MKQDSFLIKRIRESRGERGVVSSVLVAARLFLEYFYYKYLRKGSFKFQGKKLNYFYYPYNATWRNERIIEIPIIWENVKKCRGKILEVGNVLSYYFSINHDILDKYEKAKRVINKDILDLDLKRKYDLIVSISTLEHVGWDEIPKDPKKILKAIEVLKKSLNKNGRMIVTMPWGYNPNMDEMIKNGEIKFHKQFFFKRISKDNRWEEINLKDMVNIKYGKPFPFANVLFIGIMEEN